MRITKTIKRAMVARQFGVHFYRAATFKMPELLTFEGKNYALKFLDKEAGGLFIDIFLDDVYCLNYIKKVDAQVKNIVDVGSHSGFFSLFAKMTFNDANVYAFEPNPKLAHIIENQAKVGGFTYFPQGVGSHCAKAHIVEHPEFSVINRTEYDDAGEIDIIPLSQLMQQENMATIDILKLDCEGAEWDIFQDAAAFEKVKWLTMEYHLVNHRPESDLFDALKRLDFEKIKFTVDGDGWGMLLARNRRFV